MDPEYSWEDPSGQASTFKIETTRNLGWWITLALLISVILHVVLYVTLGKMEWLTGDRDAADEIVWQNKREQLTIDRDKLEAMLPKPEPDRSESEAVKPAKLSDLPLVDESLDEFEAMERAKDKEVKLTPEVDTAKIFTNERPAVAKKGVEFAADTLEVSAAEMLSKDLKDMREKLLEASVVATDQPVLELNQDDLSNTADTDDFFKNAAGKAFGDKAGKFMEGYNTLDGVIGATGGGLPSGEEKILMPTDLLFDYNEFELKEGARLSMMKLAFIVQTNPKSKFVIEGHTDTFGGEEFNINLSMKRAAAVRDWLIERLQIGADNIKIVGLGMRQPIVDPDGTIEQQALNRRVEIVIRSE